MTSASRGGTDRSGSRPGTARTLARALTAAVVVAGLATGCASSPAPAPARSTSPAPSPVPLEDPSDPEAGIVFTGLPLGTTGPTADALDTYARFEIELWRGLTTGRLDFSIRSLASTEVTAAAQSHIDDIATLRWLAGGRQTLEVSVLDATADTVRLSTCADFSEVTGREDLPERMLSLVTLTRAADGWVVDEHVDSGDC